MQDLSTEAILQSIPESLLQTLSELHGHQKSREWLQQLPDQLSAIRKNYGITILPVKHTLSYHLVLPVIYEQAAAILKMSLPNPELSNEIKVTQAVNQRQADALPLCLLANPADGWFILEALEPGAQIHHLPEQEAIAMAAQIMQNLHQVAPPTGLKHIQTWASAFQRLRQAFKGQTGPFRSDWVEQAENVYQSAGQANSQDVLLHGDLHHYNLLQDGSQWRAIDPKGMIGPRYLEPTAFIRNHLPEDPRARLSILKRRIRLFSDFMDLNPQILLQWCFAQTLLSAVWSWEDHGHIGEDELVTCGLLKHLLATNE